MNIPLIDRIVPKNNGNFPVFNIQDGYGAWQTRLNIADRDSIFPLNRYQGMICHVISDGYYYELGPSLQNTDWHPASFSVGNTTASDLNLTGQQKGSVLYYNGTNWVQLSPGTDGYQLTTHSTGNNPNWAPAASISVLSPLDVLKNGTSVGVSSIPAREDHRHSVSTASAISVGAANAEGAATTLARSDHTHIVNNLNIPGQTTGDILYFNGTIWTRLAAGTDGYFLQTHSTTSSPTWAGNNGKVISNWFVTNWFINGSTGNDSNDGLTSGTPLKTIEELCNRLCPNGEVAFLKQATIVTITSGTYGSPYFNIGSGSLTINGAITSTANITTNAVTNTSASSVIRGEIETASGTFVDQRRIRTTSGANIGAVAWSTGLNGGATKTFVSAFMSIIGTKINIANGDTVVVDTLATTFNSASFLTTVNSSIKIVGAIFSNSCYSSANVTFNTCHFSTGTILLGGGILQLCSFNTVSIGNGNYSGYGNQFLGVNNSYYAQFNFTASSVFDDCNTLIGAGVNFNFFDLELIRRTQVVGLIFPVGSKVNSTGFLWSGTGAYATTAVQMDAGSYFSFSNLPTVSGLFNIKIAGVGFTWAQLPQNVGNATAEFSTLFTSAANDLTYWTGNYWARLAAGQDGYTLTTHSTTSPPSWKKNVLDGYILAIPGQVRGDIFYYNGTNWDRLAAGTIGQALITQGVGANPKWDSNFVAQTLTTTGVLNVGAMITINNLAVNPSILQATNTTSVSTTGQTLSLISQAVSGFNSRGGNLILGSGVGTSVLGAPDGYVSINRGSQVMAFWGTGQPNPINGAIDDLIAFGKLPASQGNIRGSSDFRIWGRNTTNTGDINIFTWANNNLIFGLSNPPVATIIRSGTLTVQSTVQTQIQDSIGNNIVTFTNNSNNLGMTFGTGPAVSAAISVGQNGVISTDAMPLLVSSGNSNSFNSRGGNLTLSSGQGTSTQGASDGYVTINRGSQVVALWKVGTLPNAQIDDFIAFGKTGVPASGQIRLPQASNTSINGRNAANNGDIGLINWNTGVDVLDILPVSTGLATLRLNGASVSIQAVGNTVVNINGVTIAQFVSSGLQLSTNKLTWIGALVTAPIISQSDSLVVSVSAATMTMQAQNAAGFNSRGGNLVLGSGTGTSAQGAPDGYVIINRGTQQVAQWAGGSTFSNNTNDDFINFGRQPASQGNIRGDKNFQIWGRNNTNTGDINLMFWQGSTNNFILGATSPPTATIIRSTTTTIQSNTTTVISDFNFPILTIINSANTLAAIFNASNSAVAAELIVGSQNIQSSTTIPMLIAGSSALAFNSRGGSLTLASGSGTSGQGAPDGYLILNRGTQTVASWTTGNPNPTTIDDFISLGRIPASQGNIRGASNFNIFGRNSANTDDVSLLSYSNNTVTLSSNIKTAANTNVWGTLIQLVHGSGGVSIFDNASGSVYLNFSNSGTIRVASFVSTTTGSANISCGSLNIISTTTSPFNILAGNAIGFNSRGGNLQLSSGAGTSTQGAPDGYVLINRGTQVVASWLTGNILSGTAVDDFIALGRIPSNTGNIRLANNSSLNWRNVGNSSDISAIIVDTNNALILTGNNISLITAATSYQSMLGGIFIANNTTNPTGNPTSGIYVYCNSGTLTTRGSSGTIQILATP